MITDLIGYSTAPLFYGFMYDLTKDTAPKFAFVSTVCFGWVSLLTFCFATMFRNRNFETPNSQECKNFSLFENEKEKNIDLDKKNFTKTMNEA